MNRYTPKYIPVRVLRALMITILLVFASCLILVRTVHATGSTGRTDLVQFTAAGHILGFGSEWIYVASGDHVLRVAFSGTDGVGPVTDRMPSGDGHVQPLGRVHYPGLWSGISLIYEAVPGGIVQSSYLLEPGADVGQIRLHYNASVEIETGGSLRIVYKSGWMHESAPVAWQEINGRHIPVEVAFSIYDSSIKDQKSDIKNAMVGFALGQYDPAYPLMIDPTLKWNTFMGSTSDDSGFAIAVDGTGNVYVAGESDDTWGSPVNAHAGNYDAFVAKLNSSGVLQWNTFMGSTHIDYGRTIAVDGTGSVYVAGRSMAIWGSPVNAHAGGVPNWDAFAAKLNSSGVLQWNTFMGSTSGDWGSAIAVDGTGSVYVAGTSQATWGSPVSPYGGGINDAFAAKLNSSGVLQWNTFMGSTSDGYGYAVAVDGTGSLYVAGRSCATWGSPVYAYTGGSDAFAAKLNSSGVLQWNTFMGSTSADLGYGIAVDSTGNVYVVGESGATWGSPVNAHTGAGDAFAVKLNSSGVLQWNTFMGSTLGDWGNAIALDGTGSVYVAGVSEETWGSPVNPYGGQLDAFAAKVNSSGALQWNTFMGSASDDFGYGTAVDGSNVFVAGSSNATWGSPVNAYAGGGITTHLLPSCQRL